MFAYMDMCIYVDTYIYIYCIYIHILYIYSKTGKNIYLYISICIKLYIYIYIYINYVRSDLLRFEHFMCFLSHHILLPYKCFREWGEPPICL